jgi:hypothetical protein
MDNKELLDRLNRAYIMEEQMTGLLIDLCQPAVLPDDLSKEVRKRIEGILYSIKVDTIRHKKVVLEIKDKIK